MSKETYYYKDLVKSFEEALDEQKEDILKDKYPEDVILEIAYSFVPVYNYDLLQYASDELWLAVYEPEIEAKNAIDCIKFNIYEDFLGKGNEWLERNKSNE